MTDLKWRGWGNEKVQRGKVREGEGGGKMVMEKGVGGMAGVRS